MNTDGTFAAIVAASFLLFLSAIVAFFGTRLFWIILPIWGFFFGFAIGAQGVQALFGDGFLSTGIVVGFFGLIGVQLGVLVWLLGLAAGIVFAVLTIMLNIQKWVVVIGTSLLGAAGVVGTVLVLFNQLTPQQLADHPVKVVTDAGFGWAVLVVVIAVLAAAFQAATTQRWEVARYNRWTEYTTEPAASPGAG
jgi:hypothetical protein